MRHNGSHGQHHSTKQKGHKRVGRSTYSKKGKGKVAERLERIYLTGNYSGKE